MKRKKLAIILFSFLTLALPVSVSAQSCASGEPIKSTSIAFTSFEGTATLIGFSEYTSPSAPPKKYLTQTLSGYWHTDNWTVPNSPTCGGGTPNDVDHEVYSGTFKYSATVGSISNTQKYVYWRRETTTPIVIDTTGSMPGNFSPRYLPGGHYALNVLATEKKWVYDGVCHQPSGSFGRNASGTVTAELSTEDTEDDAEKRALASATSGTSNTAYRTSRTTGFSFSFSKVHYEATFNVTCAGEYDAVVTYSTKPHGTATATGHDVQIVRKTLQPGEHKIIGDIRVQKNDTDYTVESIELRKPCAAVPPGTPDFKLESIHVELSLGLGARQGSAGFLRLEADAITPALYTPPALTVATADNGVETVRDGTGVLRQIKAPQALADIVTLDASSYEVRFYNPAQIGAQDATTKIYALIGPPYVTYKFENPDTAQATRLKVTETRGSIIRVNEYAYDTGATTWSLSRGNGLRKESLLITTSGSDKTKTSTIRDSSNVIVSQTAKTYHTYAWGEELIQEVIDPAGAALATSYEFYSNSGSDGTNYGRLKLRTNPNGSWERHTWDASARPLKTIRPYLDAVPTAAENLCRVTESTYSALADADGDGILEQLTTTTETTVGQETRRTYRVDWSKTVTLGTDVCTRRTDIRCVAAGAAWNTPTNHVTETLLYTTDPYIGRTRRVINPDGTATLTSYTLDPSGPGLSPSNDQQTAVVKTGTPNAAGDDVTDGTRTATFTSAQGQVTGESVTDIASNLTLGSWTATQFDALGRPTRFDHADGTYETKDYACCGLSSSRDRSGLVTTYTYDDLGRQTTVSRSGLATRTAYDADSRVKSVTRIGSDNSEMVLQTSAYDLAGRPTEQRDALSRLTATSEAFDAGTGQTTRTTTTPAGTSIEVRHRDGSQLGVSGTTVAPRTFEYGLESGQPFTKQILVGDSGATTEWTKTFTDFAGRTYKTVLADSATTQSYFNTVGQLVRQTDPDSIATLFANNARGEQEVTALDVDGDSIIDYDGTDRISKTVTTVATRDSFTVQRSTTQTWEVNGSDTPVTVSVAEQSTDGLRSWQTTRGLTTTSVTTLDGSGGRTVTTTGPNGVVATQTYQANLLQSTVTSHPTLGPLSSTTYGYDAHHRQISTTDARTGTTTYTYFDDGQLHTVTTPDPDPTRSGPGYDPQVTTFAYDSAGRLDTVTQPDGGVVTTEYYPTGLVKKVSGARTYPVEYTYDIQLRVKTMTTWQDFAADAGKAVTTWNYDPQRGWLLGKRYADNTGPTYTFTAAGRLQTRTWARGAMTTYSYGPAGDLTGVDYSDATSDVAIAYDRVGRLKTMTDGAGTRMLSYHASGQLEDETYTSGLLNGLSVDRSFDSLHRLSGLSALSATSVLNPAGYSYDAASRLSAVTQGSNSVTYGYLANSSLVESVTFRSGSAVRLTTGKTYDYLNRLASIVNAPATGPAQSVAYTYNTANQRIRATREDNAYWHFAYDELGQVTSAKKHLPDSTLINGLDHVWTFDDIGNRKTATVNSQASTYSANSLNQYEHRSVPGFVDVFGAAQPDATVTATLGTALPQPTTRQGDLFYKQAAVDNNGAAQYVPVTVTGVKNLVGPNQEDAVTEVTKTAFIAQTPESFTHDADGNLTGDAKWTYTYDGENRLIAAETTSSAIAAGVTKQKLEFAYDGRSRRVSKKVYDWVGGAWTLSTSLRFIYDGWDLLAEVNDTGAAVRDYAWGLDLSDSLDGAGGIGGLLFARSNLPSPISCVTAFDGRGNIIGYIDLATGTVSARRDYSVFGEILVADGPASDLFPFGFSTKYRDKETGQIHFDFREYLPDPGRFTNHDPLEELGFVLLTTTAYVGLDGGPNLYGFARNDSLNYYDVSGLAIETAWDAFNVGTGAVSFGCNVAAGNVIGALVDGVGLVYDATATAVPGLPGGAQTVIQVYRSSKLARSMYRFLEANQNAKNVYRYAVRQGVDQGHHIIPRAGSPISWTDKALRKQMDQLRKRANKAGFDIDGAENGVALPANFHQTATTGQEYYRRVLNFFQDANTREQFIERSSRLADDLLKESGKIK